MSTTNALKSASKAPVAVHMWFADGEGWAYHPNFAGHVEEVVDALNDVLKSSQVREFAVAFRGRYLVGERVEDVDCRDPKAARRRPFIVRAALLKEAPSAEFAGLVRERLREITPATRGSSELLKVSLKPPAPPLPPSIAPGQSREELELIAARLSEEASRARHALADERSAVEMLLRRLRRRLWPAILSGTIGLACVIAAAAVPGSAVLPIAGAAVPGKFMLLIAGAVFAGVSILLTAAAVMLARRHDPRKARKTLWERLKYLRHRREGKSE